MAKTSMVCWICGDVATTGEHRIKYSDLKYLYPYITQKTPLFHRRDGEKQKHNIGSLKSNHLKFDALLCAKCNNERTQPYDKAWEELSNYLRENWDDILKVNKVYLLNIFPKNTIINMVDVQLFFVKIFGCKIKESDAPINLVPFSESLLDNSENHDVYIFFRDSDIEMVGNYCSISNIDILYKDDTKKEIIYAHMFYTVGQITIDMIYCIDTFCNDLYGAIKPTLITNNTIPISNGNYKDALASYVQSNISNYKIIL